MLKKLTGKEVNTIRLSLLMAETTMVMGRNPSILEVKKCAPRIAAELQRLGYDELTSDLFRAFVRMGRLAYLDRNELSHLDEKRFSCVLE